MRASSRRKCFSGFLPDQANSLSMEHWAQEDMRHESWRKRDPRGKSSVLTEILRRLRKQGGFYDHLGSV